MKHTRVNTALVATMLIAALAFLSIAGYRQVVTGQETKQAAAKATPAKTTNPADISLGQAIDHILDSSELKQGRWGVMVASLKEGRVVYSRNADQLFPPASNMKIYTPAVALDTLGGDYRWRTSLYAAKGPDAQGVINGDLVLYGRGAPDLVSKVKSDQPSLAKFADQLYAAGVRQVQGNIIGDESYFRGELFGTGWQWNDLQWYYGAEPSALSVDENTVEVTMSPGGKIGEAGTVVVTPNENYLHLVNTTATGARDAATSIGIMRELSGNDV